MLGHGLRPFLYTSALSIYFGRGPRSMSCAQDIHELRRMTMRGSTQSREKKSGVSDPVRPPSGRILCWPMPQSPVGAWSSPSGATPPPASAPLPGHVQLSPLPADAHFLHCCYLPRPRRRIIPAPPVSLFFAVLCATRDTSCVCIKAPIAHVLFWEESSCFPAKQTAGAASISGFRMNTR